MRIFDGDLLIFGSFPLLLISVLGYLVLLLMNLILNLIDEAELYEDIEKMESDSHLFLNLIDAFLLLSLRIQIGKSL